MTLGKDGRSLYLVICAVAVLILGGFGLLPFAGSMVIAAAFAAGVVVAGRLAPGNNDLAPKAEQQTEDVALMDNVVAALPYPVIVVGQGGMVLSFNQAAGREFSGFRAGRPVATVLRSPAIVRAVDNVLSGGATEHIEFSAHSPVERSYGAVVCPIQDQTHAFIALSDLTEAKRVEQLRADFVANASHELRTPLASLTGFIETIQGPAKDDAEAQAEFLDIMAAQAARMGRLIEDLLSLSRIELNEHVVPKETAPISGVIGEIFSAIKLTAEARNIGLTNTVQSDVSVVGEADQLTQVFQNLIDNAVKYGREGTDVDISLSNQPPPRPGLIGIAVRDQGIGISRQHLPRLTERFYRVDVAQSRERGGTGLGLAIVKHIVNRHRGVLTIDSEEGQGSTFTVWLPQAES